ncbi:iron ABC transporter [Novosphingobium sp. PC22D]|uniref:ABC transporter substrate-binding protein n=1 Tax=Novosphingobium sp. PC22D TaxID=1962403 RepID=UPI000BEF338B|nr:ABC transporter substrate-binding protein [Novosphingobium sp. PC22D]PEQ14010.1 iron ABC transporter [Novosphingobium sp. PC22D]
MAASSGARSLRSGAVIGLAGLGAALAWIGAAPAGPTPAAQPGARPRRIVSLNLCADQYLLALADRDQIAGLTRNATDPDLSAAAKDARGLRILGQSAEEILEIQPDLIIGARSRRSPVLAALPAQDYRLVDLAWATSFAQIAAQTRQIADAVGHHGRGAALVARMERDLAGLPQPGKGRVAAYYQRRGYLTGTGTLVDDLMQRAGLVNLAGRLDKPALSRLSLEELVAARPDFIIVEAAAEKVSDQGTEMLQHPALRGVRRIVLPQAWTVCGGPAYVRAARSLVEQLGAS